MPSGADDPESRWLGPLGVWELVRLARRGVPLRARLAVGGLMILALAGVAAGFLAETGMGLSALGFAGVSQDRHARLGERFAFAAVLAPLGAVILLAPGYAAAAVVEEKERRTLETLLSTPLDDWAIVRDKFVSRLALVLALVLSGLPVVMFVLPLGGADPTGVVTAYAVTVAAAVLLVAVGIWAGCTASDLRGAAVRAYAWTAAYVFAFGCPFLWPFSPLGVIVGLLLGWIQQVGVAYLLGVFFPLFIAAMLLRGAAAELRREEDYNDAARRVPDKPLDWRPPPAVAEAYDPVTATPAPMFVRPGPRAHPWHERPVLLDDRALLWKEMHVTGRVPTLEGEVARKVARVVERGVVIAVAMLILLGMLSTAGGGSGGRQFLLFGGTLAATAFATAVGAAAAASVARERRQKTLDALRALPVPRSEILSAKWLVCWERGPWWGAFGFLAVGMSFVGTGLPLMVAAVGFVVAGWFAVVNGALRLAVRYPEGVVARRLIGLLAAFAVAPVAAWYAADLTGDPRPVAALVGGLAVAAAVLARVWWRQAVRELEQGG